MRDGKLCVTHRDVPLFNNNPNDPGCWGGRVGWGGGVSIGADNNMKRCFEDFFRLFFVFFIFSR